MADAKRPARRPTEGTRGQRPDHARTSAEAERADNKWQLLRWDLLVFAIAAVGFFVNWRWPYELSSSMMLVFFIAMVWVAYRMHQKLEAFKRQR